MNREPETPSHHPHRTAAAAEPSGPMGFLDAIAALIATRIALIQLEARATARKTAIRVLCVILAALCLLFAWLLLVAGLIGALVIATGWPWHWLAIAAALMHLVAALALLVHRQPSEPPFPLTRAEFEKDRQWLENLKKKNASGN